MKRSEKEDFESMSPAKRVAVRIISAIVFMLLIWGVVAATDGIIGMLRL